MATKNTRIASFTTTSTAFAVADSRAPLSSRKPHMKISTIGGRLMRPEWNSAPCSPETMLGVRKNSGMPQPKAFCKKLFRYSDQPMATALPASAYSSSRQAATI